MRRIVRNQKGHVNDFNPRTHVGCDNALFATTGIYYHFNPRTHVGCDLIQRFGRVHHNRFQSTHPRGVRHHCANGFVQLSYFNPRTHVGCDFALITDIEFTDISIHAPTWGATNCTQPKRPRQRFQSTHPRGVRQRFICDHGYILSFQSTHPRGVRLNTAIWTCPS